jgi:hypothetical protein
LKEIAKNQNKFSFKLFSQNLVADFKKSQCRKTAVDMYTTKEAVTASQVKWNSTTTKLRGAKIWQQRMPSSNEHQGNIFEVNAETKHTR